MGKDGHIYLTMENDKDGSKYMVTLDEPIYHGTIKGTDSDHFQELTMGLKFSKKHDFVYGNGRDSYGVFTVHGTNEDKSGKIKFELEYVNGEWKMDFSGEVFEHGQEKVMKGHWSHSQGSGSWELK